MSPRLDGQLSRMPGFLPSLGGGRMNGRRTGG